VFEFKFVFEFIGLVVFSKIENPFSFHLLPSTNSGSFMFEPKVTKVCCRPLGFPAWSACAAPPQPSEAQPVVSSPRSVFGPAQTFARAAVCGR
jgi:hypothetical protein